jgi:hypothetical protein
MAIGLSIVLAKTLESPFGAILVILSEPKLQV